MESKTDLPFICEYAKSGRASCKGCKEQIGKDDLRLGIMVQSPHFDGKIPNWFHGKCFWKKSRVKTEGDIHGFDSLRWDDQEDIRKKIKDGDSGVSGALKNPDLSDFAVEYAVSGRAKCKGCIEKIENKSLRISRMDYDSKGGRLAGGVPAWYHMDCFVAKREELEYWEAGDKMPGFDKLTEEDQKALKSKLKSKKRKAEPAASSDSADGPSDAKKMKNGEPAADEAEKNALKEQSQLLWKIRDSLTKNVSKRQMSELLECNGQEIPSGESKILDRLSDCMAFGTLELCPECKNGQLVYSSTDATYLCTGAISGFTRCQHRTLDPARKDFKIPKDFKEIDYLGTFKFKSGRKRVVPTNRPAPTSQESTEPSLARSLDFLRFVIHPKLAKENPSLAMAVKKLGGAVIKALDPTVIALIANEDDLKNIDKDKMLTKAKEGNVHVVSADFLDGVKADLNVAELVQKHSIATWGGDVEKKVNNCRYTKSIAYKKQKDEDKFKSMATTAKMVVKGGGVVDPDSYLETVTHVHEDSSGGYAVVLGVVDVQSGVNSFYKLQLLKHDTSEKWWVFRAWGRVGTTIGGNKTQSMSKSEAMAEFKRLYVEKTGNEWEDRKNFVKYPGKFYPLEMDYGEDDDAVTKSSVEAGSKSKLAKPIQEILKLIFDIEQMKQTMKEFEIDLKKMPLGKISKNQVKQAYSVLTELQKIMTDKGDKVSNNDILDASNRFYTLIPHDFGMQKPPLLDKEEIIKAKTDMLDNLLEIEIAFNMLKNVGADAEADPLDGYYQQLKTDFEVVDKESDEFGRVKEYVKNTHAATHSNYELAVEEVFKINRHGEDKRFKPFKKLPNHQLLWHGSRVSNFGGILSQGLRIAPPEAPSTGYMFGKGIYFADMVSKSANYCRTMNSNPTGLLMLCDVALGEMEIRKHSDFITTLPPGKHSCWGQGQTAPDPAGNYVDEDGVIMPKGKGISQAPIVGNTSLLYNEFIVYDVAQVRMKYLIRMQFKFKY